jgi:hypothetical protein
MKLLQLSITLILGWAFTWASAQEVSNVKAIQNKNIITLMWTVNKEPSPYICYIEYSTDGSKYKTIAKVNGKQSYLDKQYFYQIKDLNVNDVSFRIKKVYTSNSTVYYSDVVTLKSKVVSKQSPVFSAVTE